MRTTITIDESLLKRLEDRSAAEGTTVSRLIEDAVRLSLRERAGRRKVPAFRLVTFGKGGRFTTFDVDKGSRLVETEDVAHHGRTR